MDRLQRFWPLGPIDSLDHQEEKTEDCETEQQIDDHHRG
jgi:hypothetical protein